MILTLNWGCAIAEEKEQNAQENLKRTYAEALGMKKDSDLSPERNEEGDNREIEEENKKKLNNLAEQFKNAEIVFRDDKGIKINLTKKFEERTSEKREIHELWNFEGYWKGQKIKKKI